ncbi:DUF2169 family type VI secretion system accessory protein [Aquisalimonas sp. APHAB1-3]|uniref:DUF2169 family type VI secretion system accessory protein n=1 Tax=Aquisalimonas sp. APHAB1-3 TaxID=3402080 RepID=UPI003AAC4218
MLQLANESPYAASLATGWALNGAPQWTLTVKATYRFSLTGEVTLHDEQPEVVEGDQYRGKPAESSLEAAWESVPHKAGGELYLFGTAHPGQPGANGVQVRVQIDRDRAQAWEKRLVAVGPSRWERGALGYYRTPLEPMEPVPLCYEMAFGGHDPRTAGEERRNPVGRGFNSGQWRLHDTRLPLIERPDRFMSAPRQRMVPIGLGPLAPHWDPRRREAGNVSEARLEAGGCPYGSKTLPTVHNAAPPDQRFDKPFSGGERVTLEGLFPEHGDPVRVTLPPLQPVVWLHETHRMPLRGACDTLIVDSDAMVFHLLYRCVIPWEIDARRRGYVVLPPVPGPPETTSADSDQEAPA